MKGFNLILFCASVFGLVVSSSCAAADEKTEENIARTDQEVWGKRSVHAKKVAHEAYNPHPEDVTKQFNRRLQSTSDPNTVGLRTDDIAKNDEVVWGKRSAEAKKHALEAYNPNPANVTNQINMRVQKSVESNTKNKTRRGLQEKYNGPCVASNPIDQCYRCDHNWEKNRMKLADCGLGFGRDTTGGKGGRIYVVTDPSDKDMINPKPGTLRHAVIQTEPLWIIFKGDMVIKLAEELIMAGNKTIDGRGAEVHIANGAGLTLQFVQNIIIHNIHVHDIKAANGGLIRSSVDHYGFRTKSDGDGITVFGSTNIWIDHISMFNAVDGLIDVVESSTAVTISNCQFTRHNEVLLFGASDSYTDDKIMQVTVAFNHFGKELTQRMPRVRYGFVHVVNNDYTQWGMYAIGGSSNPTILSQGNRFVAPDDINCKEVTKRDYAEKSEWKNWVWKSQGDLMMNGAFFVESGDPNYKFSHTDQIHAKPGDTVDKLTQFSGALLCVPNSPC